MKEIKLMADYDCYPLWKTWRREYDNVAPETLGLSESLIQDLILWADKYDSTLNRQNPVESGFKSCQDEQDFEQEGMRLFNCLKSQLEGEYLVVYFSNMEGKLYT